MLHSFTHVIKPFLLAMEEIVQFESMIQDLLVNQFAICDDFIDESLLALLLAELAVYKSQGAFKEAGIGRKADQKTVSEIRGDFTKWVDNKTLFPGETLFLSKMVRFQDYLNSTCYTSLNDFEGHFADYPQGSFYKKHKDQFKGNNDRQFSLIIYLNENWTLVDGGQLIVYPLNKAVLEILPMARRAVFFKSDELLHEVLPSNTRSRQSITGWLKKSAVIDLIT